MEMETVGWLIAASMIVGFLLFVFIKAVVKDDKNKFGIPADEKEELIMLVDAIHALDFSKKLMGLILVGGMAISECVVWFINLPFKKKK